MTRPTAVPHLVVVASVAVRLQALSEEADFIAFALLAAVPAVQRVRAFHFDATSAAQGQARRTGQCALAIRARHGATGHGGTGLAALAAVLGVDVCVDTRATAGTERALALKPTASHLALRRCVRGRHARRVASSAIGRVCLCIHA